MPEYEVLEHALDGCLYLAVAARRPAKIWGIQMQGQRIMLRTGMMFPEQHSVYEKRHAANDHHAARHRKLK